MRAGLLVIFAAACAAQTTAHYSNTRLGANTSETILTPATVAASFGKLRSCAVDGPIYGQPLYVSGVSGKNLLIVATMNDSIYAFDADSAPCTAVWSRLAFDTTWSSGFPETPVLFDSGNIGCVATPVVDQANGFVYAICANNTPNWVIWQFNLSTGATVNSTTLAPTVTGTGDPAGGDHVTGGVLSFYPKYAICRPGLTLANGNVYAACGSFDDLDPWHGWIVDYNASTLAQAAVWCSTPNGAGGSLWMSGGGLAVDASGNLYGVTGNGDWDGAANFGESAVKLSSSLALLDWYTPSNWSTLNSGDIDLGSGQPMLIPSTNLLVWGAKDFKTYSVNTTCMGHLAGTVGGCTAPQTFTSNPSPPVGAQLGVFMNIFMNGIGYFSNSAFISGSGTLPESIYACTLTASTWNTTCTASSATFQYPGAAPAGSINGTSNGIIWMLTDSASSHTTAQPATLRAVSPVDFTEYWNSGAGIGSLSKFVQPTIANGKVFVATLDSGVQIFGLSPSTVLSGSVVRSGSLVTQ